MSVKVGDPVWIILGQHNGKPAVVKQVIQMEHSTLIGVEVPGVDDVVLYEPHALAMRARERQ